MKRAKKRWTTEQQILDAIDAARERATECLKQAILEDAVAESNRKQIGTLESSLHVIKGKARNDCLQQIATCKHVISLARDNAVKLSKRRNRLELTTLPRLKDTLAAFRTGLLEAITSDLSVVSE